MNRTWPQKLLRPFLAHDSSFDPEGRGEDLEFGGDIVWAQSCTLLWTACILLFSRIFLLYPHMFSLWLLSSLGLYVIMLLGNCRRMMRSVGCVRVPPLWCVFTSAVRDAVQYATQVNGTHCNLFHFRFQVWGCGRKSPTGAFWTYNLITFCSFK